MEMYGEAKYLPASERELTWSFWGWCIPFYAVEFHVSSSVPMSNCRTPWLVTRIRCVPSSLNAHTSLLMLATLLKAAHHNLMQYAPLYLRKEIPNSCYRLTKVHVSFYLFNDISVHGDRGHDDIFIDNYLAWSYSGSCRGVYQRTCFPAPHPWRLPGLYHRQGSSVTVHYVDHVTMQIWFLWNVVFSAAWSCPCPCGASIRVDVVAPLYRSRNRVQ